MRLFWQIPLCIAAVVLVSCNTTPPRTGAWIKTGSSWRPLEPAILTNPGNLLVTDHLSLDSPINYLPRSCWVWIYSEAGLPPCIAPVFEEHLSKESIFGQMEQAMSGATDFYYYLVLRTESPSNIRQTTNRFVVAYEFDLSPQQLEATFTSKPVVGLWALITAEGVYLVQAR